MCLTLTEVLHFYNLYGGFKTCMGPNTQCTMDLSCTIFWYILYLGPHTSVLCGPNANTKGNSINAVMVLSLYGKWPDKIQLLCSRCQFSNHIMNTRSETSPFDSVVHQELPLLLRSRSRPLNLCRDIRCHIFFYRQTQICGQAKAYYRNKKVAWWLSCFYLLLCKCQGKTFCEDLHNWSRCTFYPTSCDYG